MSQGVPAHRPGPVGPGRRSAAKRRTSEAAHVQIPRIAIAGARSAASQRSGNWPAHAQVVVTPSRRFSSILRIIPMSPNSRSAEKAIDATATCRANAHG